MTVMPREAREWTVEDLDQVPGDGLQYELLDGMLLVTPAPAVKHQVVVGNLYDALKAARVSGFSVLFAPLDWRPHGRTSLQPDLLVVRDVDLEATSISDCLVLAVEVLSPSTRRKDLLLKRSAYEEAGVPSYWIVDPDVPSLLALELAEGHYQKAAQVTGSDQVTLEVPFPVTIQPSALLGA